MGELLLATKRNDYLCFILRSLHIEINDFIHGILRPEGNYERQLYEWILQLYEKGKDQEQALEIIYEIRNHFFIRKEHQPSLDLEPTESLHKLLLHILEINSRYLALYPVGQSIVQERIARLMKMGHATNIVQRIQRSTSPLNEIEKINAALITGDSLLVKVKDNIKTYS